MADTQLEELVIYDVTKEQFEGLTDKDPDSIYLVPDEGSSDSGIKFNRTNIPFSEIVEHYGYSGCVELNFGNLPAGTYSMYVRMPKRFDKTAGMHDAIIAYRIAFVVESDGSIITNDTNNVYFPAPEYSEYLDEGFWANKGLRTYPIAFCKVNDNIIFAGNPGYSSDVPLSFPNDNAPSEDLCYYELSVCTNQDGTTFPVTHRVVWNPDWSYPDVNARGANPYYKYDPAVINTALSMWLDYTTTAIAIQQTIVPAGTYPQQDRTIYGDFILTEYISDGSYEVAGMIKFHVEEVNGQHVVITNLEHTGSFKDRNVKFGSYNGAIYIYMEDKGTFFQMFDDQKRSHNTTVSLNYYGANANSTYHWLEAYSDVPEDMVEIPVGGTAVTKEYVDSVVGDIATALANI